MIDVSRPIFENMTVWPGEQSVTIERVISINDGYQANVSRIHAGTHTGTHVDAPLHFIDGGKAVDELDIQLFTGWVRLVDVSDVCSITRECLLSVPINKGEAVFFKTSSSRRTLKDSFDTSYTGLDFSAAQYLLEMEVRVVGIDTFSVEPFDAQEFKVHKTLLGNNVLIIENLCFQNVAPGRYRYICLPLLIQESDGAPARVMLIEERNTVEDGFHFGSEDT